MNKISIPAPLLAAMLLLMPACPSSTSTTPSAAPATSLPASVMLQGEIFASRWSVTIPVETDVERLRAQSLAPRIEAALHEVEREMSLWKDDSELSKFNRSTSTSAWPVSRATARLVKTALDVGAGTDGAFDVTVGPLLDVWGFSPRTKGTVATPPTAEAITAAKALTGLGKLTVAAETLTKSVGTLHVDITAIGDGAAAAAVGAVLRERGLSRFLVDVAGEILVSGASAGGAWRVGVNTPAIDAGDSDTIRMVALAPTTGELMALSTSGTYREGWVADGHRYSHIIDPTTGAPTSHNLVSCTVTGTDVIIADALSTGCIVLGEAGMRRILPRFAGYEALFVVTGDGGFTVTTTAGFPPSP